jgi:hypothetical protein
MALTISLPAEAEARLKERAAAAGCDVASYVADLVRHFADAPTPLELLSGPIQERFAASGLTEDELADELERTKHLMRAQRRERNAD